MTTAVDTNIKSILPPRKRAKTLEEKEQRRMERILRNRRAAHASREKKRRHVEFLEVYVVALERNASVLSSNIAKLKDALPEGVSIELGDIEDVSDLKSKVHSCMTNSFSTSVDSPSLHSNTPESVCQDTSLGSLDVASADEESKTPICSAKVKVEEPDVPLIDLQSSGGYYNYLSPVSINSPVNSPIDLTIKPEESSTSFVDSVHFLNDLDAHSATSGPDFSAQNSAAILSLKGIPA